MSKYKTAALYLYAIIGQDPCLLFQFQPGTASENRRATLALYMYTLIYGVLPIKRGGLPADLRDDLEYVLLLEHPCNIEWLCLTMRAWSADQD